MTVYTKNLDKVSPQLPEDLGQKDMAGSTSVVLASDYVLPITSADDHDAGPTTADTLRVVVANDQTAIPVSQSGAWTVTVSASALPTGAATEATLSTVSTTASAISGKLPATLGTKTKATALGVTLASDESPLAVTQSGAWTTAITAAALPLPSGAATESTLSTLSGHVPQLALGAGLAATSLRTVIATDQAALPVSQSGTWTISGISGTVSLPTGAATETTLSGMSAKLPATLGAKTGANSVSVVFASDQASLQPTHAKVALLRNDHSSVAVSTSAYTQLTASTTAAIKRLHIFDSSGSALYLAVGAAASEVDYIFIPPGGIEWIEIDIPTASRLSVKAVDTATSAGQLLITALS